MTIYLCPVKAESGYHFYTYDGAPGLVSEPVISEALDLDQLRRVCVLLEEGRPGFELMQQRWSSHLQPGHDLLELHHIDPPWDMRNEAKVLKAGPRSMWAPEWLDAAHFIECSAIGHNR